MKFVTLGSSFAKSPTISKQDRKVFITHMRPPRAAVVSSAVIAAVMLIAGCAEQPTDYIYTPTHRDHSKLAQTAVTVLDAIYEHTDQAASYLDKASLTDDYLSLLPSGWAPYQMVDSTTGEPYILYTRNYLDQHYYGLRFDVKPVNGAVRSPSDLQYTYIEINSLQNPVTNEFYGNVNQTRRLSIEYSDQRRDANFVDGMFEIRRIVPFEEEIEVAGAGTVTYNVYVTVNWLVKIERFSIDPNDQRARLVIEGIMPLYDEAGQYQQPHVSGEININTRGRGTGDLSLYGDPAVRLHITGRTFGFRGYYTLYSENHEKRYRFEQ